MEVLLSTDEAELSKLSVNFWSTTTGTKLLSLRGPTALARSLAFIRDEGLLIIEAGKPFIHFWQSGHSLQSSRRILCPGKPGAMAMTPDGSFLAVAIEEKIYIWQVATGRIVSVVTSAHYRPVAVLKFTDDGTYLVSGGQDGLVLCWKLLPLVSGQTTLPKYSWTDHSSEITGIHIGYGGVKSSVFTVSSDRTAKVYSLVTGTLLLSVSYPVALTTIVADGGEFSFYVGSTTGSIYQMKLQSAPRSIEHHISSDAMADSVFKKHKEPITALSISADGRTLGSGDIEGLILLWDTETKQAIKTIVGGKAKVTNLLFWLGNPEVLKGGRKAQIIFPEVPKLVEQSDDRNEMDQTVLVWNREERTPYTPESFRPASDETPDTASIEISRLKAELERSERINARLHEFCLEHVMGQASSSDNLERIPKKTIVKTKLKKQKLVNDETEVENGDADADEEGETETVDVEMDTPEQNGMSPVAIVKKKKKKKVTGNASLKLKRKGSTAEKDRKKKKSKNLTRKRRVN